MKNSVRHQICALRLNVWEIDPCGQFHQRFTQSFYPRKYQKCKKYSLVISVLKGTRKMLVKLTIAHTEFLTMRRVRKRVY